MDGSNPLLYIRFVSYTFLSYHCTISRLIAFVICFLITPHDFAYQNLCFPFVYVHCILKNLILLLKAQNISFLPWHGWAWETFKKTPDELIYLLRAWALPTFDKVFINFYYNSIVMVYWGDTFSVLSASVFSAGLYHGPNELSSHEAALNIWFCIIGILGHALICAGPKLEFLISVDDFYQLVLGHVWYLIGESCLPLNQGTINIHGIRMQQLLVNIRG